MSRSVTLEEVAVEIIDSPGVAVLVNRTPQDVLREIREYVDNPSVAYAHDLIIFDDFEDEDEAAKLATELEAEYAQCVVSY